ncbi:hypothetical protein [Algoriphagus mannitolivorans]|uniref:hypothetical protein n=1 Tax=Algoriphagus mannitolivorans TaxID=226504 RepID=UPI00068769CA|nr:hypothetical protein [Algoriphagus mannitolivorans]
MTPSFGYLDSLSGGNDKFKEKIIKILISELPKEHDLLKLAIQSDNFFWAAEIVHRIKQKVSFLAMEDAYKVVDQFENEIREGELKNLQKFEEIIHKILNFLARTHE